MQIEQLTNNALTTFEQELDRQLDKCESFSIGAAFIDKTGIQLLRRFLARRRGSNRHGRVLTGLLGRFNTQANLRQLQQLTRGYSGRLQAAISRTEHFHWKFYAFYFRRKVVVYMGSANFTQAGITATGEWMTRITADRTSDKRIIESWEKIFAAEWDDAILIKEFPVRWYKEISTRGSGAAVAGLDPKIKALLKRPKKPAKSGTEPERIRILLLKGRLSARTVSTVKRYKSQWERNNWKYFSCGTKAGFDADRQATHFILVWKEGRHYSFYWVKQIGTYETIGTPDGRYFIACKQLKPSIPETPKIKAVLEANNIFYHSRTFKAETLKKSKAQRLKATLGLQN